MKPLYILGLILAIIIFFTSIILFKKRKLNIRGLILWATISIGLAIISLSPRILEFVLKMVSIGLEAKGLFVLAISIFILFLIIYFLFISQKRIEKTVSKLIQEIAILSYKLDKNINPKERDDEKQRIHLDG